MRTPHAFVFAAWIAWVLSWMVAAVWSRRTVRHAGFGLQSLYRIPETLGFVLLIGIAQVQGLPRAARHATGIYLNHLWRTPASIAWLCATLVVAGFLFTWWARLYLGPLWSSSITRKQDHRVVDTGPYRLVRHPIYTGILVSAAATTILNGTAAALAGTLLLLFAFYLKARQEERFLRAELDAGTYDAYAGRTPMLIPFTAGHRRD
jgi:protein-S-isoprenylcysteine O-methyltransferase Ste14